VGAGAPTGTGTGTVAGEGDGAGTDATSVGLGVGAGEGAGAGAGVAAPSAGPCWAPPAQSIYRTPFLPGSPQKRPQRAPMGSHWCTVEPVSKELGLGRPGNKIWWGVSMSHLFRA